MCGLETTSERTYPSPSSTRIPGWLCSTVRRGRELRVRRSWAAIALVLSWLATAGCSLTRQSDSYILASVVLRGNTPGQISNVTSEVFQEHDYKVTEAGLNRLVLEKKGSRMNTIAYGSWLSDEPIWVRVRASIVPVGEATYRLQCRAWLVRDRETAAEEEIKIRRMHRRPYEKLLQEVATRLGAKTTAAP